MEPSSPIGSKLRQPATCWVVKPSSRCICCERPNSLPAAALAKRTLSSCPAYPSLSCKCQRPRLAQRVQTPVSRRRVDALHPVGEIAVCRLPLQLSSCYCCCCCFCLVQAAGAWMTMLLHRWLDWPSYPRAGCCKHNNTNQGLVYLLTGAWSTMMLCNSHKISTATAKGSCHTSSCIASSYAALAELQRVLLGLSEGHGTQNILPGQLRPKYHTNQMSLICHIDMLIASALMRCS